MLTGVRVSRGLQVTADQAGIDELAAALEQVPGSYAQLGLQRPDQTPARLTGIRVRVKGGDAAVSITRIGDVIHINGSAAKMTELAAALRGMKDRINLWDQDAVAGGSDLLEVRRA
jgi:hypothetical protein